MLKRSFHPGFGWVVVRNIYDRGDVSLVDATATLRSHIFYTKGSFVWTDKESGEHVLDCAAGRFIHSNDAPRLLLMGEATSDKNVFFCIDPKVNRGAIPDISPVLISEEITFPAGSRLFLCDGAVEIKGKTISGPAQIKMTFDTSVINVDGTAYGLLFL